MRVVLKAANLCLRVASISLCVAATAIGAHAQTAVPVFSSSLLVRPSTSGVTADDPDVFGVSVQNLSCPASGIVAKVTSTTDGTGKILIDNKLSVTFAGGGTIVGPTNICRGGVVEGSGQHDCFTAAYQTPAGEGLLNGQDPNTLAATGGVGPLDISTLLASGANTVRFDLVDTGGYLAASSVYLYTNCTSTGTGGGGTISGNPISSSNPASLTQPFTFNSTPDLAVELLFDLSTAESAGTLTIPTASTPTVTDKALDPAAFPGLVQGTSFATSQCIIHNGELLDGNPACKLYTLTCQLGSGSEASGLNCPKSSVRNVVLQDVFDFPALSLPDITYVDGSLTETFHQGFGFLEASESWTNGFCTFESGSDQIFSCPENLLTQFSGPGAGRSTGTPAGGFNSSFITIGPVPEYSTSVVIAPYSANKIWVNSFNPTATFKTRSPKLPPNFNGGDLNGFTAAAPYGITYGIAPEAGYPSTPSTEFPVPGDQTILYPGGCPTPGTPAPDVWAPAPVQLHIAADGMYRLHYFATDCAGTEELYFRQEPSGSWYTTFYTVKLYVDTVKPQILSGPTFSCKETDPTSCFLGTLNDGTMVFKQGTRVKATYQCSDDFSGVATCGEATYADPVTNPPAYTSGVNTSTVGLFRYFVHVTDQAGNNGAEVLVYYAVLP